MTQLLIYKNAVPVTRARHADCSVEVGADYAFSGDINSVPLMTVEFAFAVQEYAIVFAGPPGEITPAAILGVRTNENLFLSRGVYDGKYVPAFLRRYPFVFSRSDDRFLLCVDEEFPGFNREGRGQKLFDANGEPSRYTDNVLKFMTEFQAQFLRTQAFCGRLEELGLLEPMQAQITEASGARASLRGFSAVSRAKLAALPGETLATLAKGDDLELLYLHLHSMRNFDRLKERMEQQALEQQAAARPDELPTAVPMPPAMPGSSDVVH